MRADARRNRELLLDAALEAFTERGADDTSLEEIARRAGVGIGTLYRHFPGRTALLEAVYTDQVAALCQRAGELLATEPAGAALAAWVRELAEFSATKQNLTSALAADYDKDAPVFSACRDDLLAAPVPRPGRGDGGRRRRRPGRAAAVTDAGRPAYRSGGRFSYGVDSTIVVRVDTFAIARISCSRFSSAPGEGTRTLSM
jgi:AcrR family transcriptional regulator